MDWNVRAEDMFGWIRHEALGLELAETIIPPRYREAHRHGIKRFLASGEGSAINRLIEMSALRRDGSEFPVELAISPLKSGDVVTFCGFVTDITERKRAAEEIRVLNQELEQRVRDRTSQLEAANQELEAFSYTVSHDLRAPLRHIDGYVEMLTKHAGDTLSDKSRRYLKIVSESAHEMGQLIDDLLSFSRMGRTDMQRMTVSLENLVPEIIASFESEKSTRNIVWKTGVLPNVEGDPAMLKQVFVNLLSNAVKYTRRRDPAEIEIGLGSETADEVVVFVRDNGAGFDMKYVNKLFGVFQRLHRAEEFEGTGVGLANVRRIINRHGGRIWAEGALDAGATFSFSLNKPKKG